MPADVRSALASVDVRPPATREHADNGQCPRGAERPSVILVDDNLMMLERAAAMLSPVCEILGRARDGVEGLAAIAAHHPDVVVLDISMPGMTGLEVAARLRASGSATAIVFLTVHDETEVVTAAREAGGLGYVLKVRLAADLVTAVTEARAGRPFVSPLH